MNSSAKEGFTALRIALNYYYYGNNNSENCGSICQFLLGRILHVYYEDTFSFSKNAKYALIHAAEQGYIDSVKKLINAGMYLNIKNSDNNETALKAALQVGHIKIAELLINVGATI